MAVAIDEARHAAERGEVPVGAVVVIHSDVIGLGHNQPIAAHDPTAHAEVVAIRTAAAKVGASRLDGASLYVNARAIA